MHADGHTQRMKEPAHCRCYWIRQIPICMKINNYVRSVIYVHVKERNCQMTSGPSSWVSNHEV